LCVVVDEVWILYIAEISLIAATGSSFLLYRWWLQNRTLFRRSRALQTLYDIGRAMTSTLDFQSLLELIMNLSMETIGSETASVMLADVETGDLILAC
jgi:hypothetical protein